MQFGQLKRREFISLLGGTATAWPLAARAQQPVRMRRVGILLFAKDDLAVISPFLQGLQALGYVDGKTIVIEYRRRRSGVDKRLPQAADELVRLQSGRDLFVWGRTGPPIVKESNGNHPDRCGREQRSRRERACGEPGAARWKYHGRERTSTTKLAGKAVELIKDAAPRMSRVAILWNPNHVDPEFRETQRVAPDLSVQSPNRWKCGE